MTLKATQDFFGEDSPLKTTSSKGEFKYEPRQQQVDMACAIAKAFDENRNVCIEAPTGVGKTFAYLVPALYQACKKGMPVLVSTHTIHLQEQIIQRDIPFLERLLGKNIRAEVAKGRANYLCLRKLQLFADMDQTLLPNAAKLDEVAKLIDWATNTKTGDHGDLSDAIPNILWNEVCSERGNCMGQQCPYFSNCFLFKARMRIAEAQLIISNHAFFFSALAMQDKDAEDNAADKKTKLLPQLAAVVIDEAHTLEDNAASHLALKAETFVIRKILARLYARERQRGIFADPAFTSEQEAVSIAAHKADLFFTRILQWMEPLHRNPLRYTVPNHIPNYIDEPLQAVRLKIEDAIRKIEDQALITELKGLEDALEEQRNALNTFFGMTEKDFVYWMEITGKEHQNLEFCSVPVNVAPILNQKLFANPPVVITSATLAVNYDLDFFLQRIGADDIDRLILDTPFNYEKQARLFIAQDMPDPRDPEFLDRSLPYLKRFLAQTDGRAFVLFTSYKSLKETADKLTSFFSINNYTLLKQGDGLSPRKMIQLFKKKKHAVIFGTSSFWTGVDVPGDALTNVIITKLPFAVPDHPLVEARAEMARASGKNDFMEYSVPEAVLKFRQGFGRLIRTKDDSGIVVILDSRIARKQYGRIFLESIPNCPVEYV